MVNSTGGMCVELSTGTCYSIYNIESCTIRGSMVLQPRCESTSRPCRDSSRGILQICIGGIYRSVCNDFFSNNDNSAEVACREMGYTGFKSGEYVI